jgi:hypothetical protein
VSLILAFHCCDALAPGMNQENEKWCGSTHQNLVAQCPRQNHILAANEIESWKATQ